MATLKRTIVPALGAKDGTHKVRVALGHKQVVHYIATKKPPRMGAFIHLFIAKQKDSPSL
jgi:hypothetical protein